MLSAPSTPGIPREIGTLAEPRFRPILVGTVAQTFLTAATGDRSPVERAGATAAAVTASVLAGAHMVRVHAVREMIHFVRVSDRLRAAT